MCLSPFPFHPRNADPFDEDYLPSSHVQLWELNCEEGRAPKNWCFQIVVLEKILENPVDRKELKPANPKGNQSWIFIGKTDAETEALMLWPADAKSRFNRKDPEAGKDWRKEEKGMTEDEMRWLDGIIKSVDVSLSKPWEIVNGREVWCAVGHGVSNSQTQLSN